MKKLLKIGLAAGVFSFLFYFVDFSELLNTLLNIRLDYLLLLFAIAVVMIWLSALKWQVFIKESGHSVGILHLMKLYTVGYFFNTFTPSYIGGDIARSYHLGKYLGSQKDAFASTFLERFSGLLAMSILGVLFVTLGAKVTAGVEIAIFLVAFLASSLALIFFSKTVSKLFEKTSTFLINKFLPEKISSKLLSLQAKVLDAISSVRGNTSLLIKALLLSLAFHVGTVVNTWAAAKAVGWEDPSFMGLFVVVPLVLLVSMVPITPAGIGIQEGAFLFFLQRIGGTKAQGLGVGVLLRAKVMVIALLGGLIWLLIRKSDARKSDTSQEILKEDTKAEPEDLLKEAQS